VRIWLPIALAAALAAGEGMAAVRTQTVEYRQGDAVLQGTLAWDDARSGRRPGVLVAHDWMGETEATRAKARDVAGLGYIAFAVDIYGKGVRPANREQAAAEAGRFRGDDRTLLRARMRAALDTLKKDPRVDPDRIAAIGYCFGGGAVLELARSGADVDGVVSFHGSLTTPNPADAKSIKGKVLVLHGADDPGAPLEHVLQLNKEMKEGGVDYQIVLYGHAVHSFTNENAGRDPSTGNAYEPRADRRSWEAMRDFLQEVFQAR